MKTDCLPSSKMKNYARSAPDRIPSCVAFTLVVMGLQGGELYIVLMADWYRMELAVYFCN